METVIILLAFTLLVIVSAYVISKLDDKLMKSKNDVKNLEEKLNVEKEKAKFFIQKSKLLEEQIDDLKKSMSLIEHRRQALQVDYDRLLTDYNNLEGK